MISGIRSLAGRLALLMLLSLSLWSCGVYSFTGASIEGKTLYMEVFENHARNVVPSLAPSLTTKIRSRILTQTGLTPVNSEEADYIVKGRITGYELTVTGIENTQSASTNRLTITIEVDFENQLNEADNFVQTFSQFADFPANQTLQSQEAALMEKIGNQLADDLFNKAFVNW